jgi:transcriptional regulator with XRE-family HTH domain
MLRSVEDRRVGLILRALRLRKGLRQADVAAQAGVSQTTASRAERGHLGSLSLDTTRRLLATVEARTELEVRWRGGELDRLVDERHAHLVAAAAVLLAAWGWTVLAEVTFAVYGERGSIDLLAVRPAERLAAIFEMKATLASWEATQRRFDVKVRLLPRILEERLGWRPGIIGRFLVFEEDTTTRRRLARLGPIVAQAFPTGSRQARRWLREPSGSMAAIWFLSVSHRRTRSRKRGGSGPRGGLADAAVSVDPDLRSPSIGPHTSELPSRSPQMHE